MIQHEDILNELMKDFASFIMLYDTLIKLEEPTLNEAMIKYKKIKEEKAKSNAEIEFREFEKRYAQNHDFAISFSTPEAKEKATAKGYKTLQEMFVVWKDSITNNPNLAYSVVVAASIFTSSSQYFNEPEFFAEKIGLDPSLDISFIKINSKDEGLIKENITMHPSLNMESIRALQDMGISISDAIYSLAAADFNVEAAVNILFSGDLENIKRDRAINLNDFINYTISLATNFRDDNIVGHLINAFDDPDKFYLFMKAVGLKNSIHYMNCAEFAKNICFVYNIDVDSIILKAFHDGFVSVKDLNDAGKSFGKKMSDLPEETRTRLTNDFKDLNQDVLAFLYFDCEQNIERLVELLRK